MQKELSEMSLEELWQLFPIVLTKPDERWASYYDEEQKLLHHILADMNIVRISHIGSTAICSIWAKPIIAILIEVKDNQSFNAFRSFNYPVLAEAGIHIKYNNVQIRFKEVERELKPHYLLDTNVAVLKLFPGIQENVVSSILSIEGLKAVVLETYGSGNAPRKEWFIRRLRNACEQGIVIVNVTQCSAGTVEMERYETGYQLMQAGVVCGYDSTTESAVTKLMFLLGHGYTPDEVRKRMRTPMAGEITT